MDNAARTRQRVLAIFLFATAVLYISAEALSPKGTDQVISTTATALKVLPIAARHPARTARRRNPISAQTSTRAELDDLGAPPHRSGPRRSHRQWLPHNPMAMPAMTVGHPPAATRHSEPETATGYAHRTKRSGHDHSSDRFCKRLGATRRSSKDRRSGGTAVPLVHGHLLHR